MCVCIFVCVYVYGFRCTPDEKFLILYAVLRLRTGGRRSLVFVNSIDHGYKVKLFLDNFGIRAAVLNSELPATSRAHILSSYNRGVCDILIATDEALIDQTELATVSEGTRQLPSVVCCVWRRLVCYVWLAVRRSVLGWCGSLGRDG